MANAQIAEAAIGRYAPYEYHGQSRACAHRDDLKTPVRAHRDW